MVTKLRTHKTLTDTVSWSASGDRQITLPNEGLVTRIVLHYNLTVTGILAADTNTEFAQWKAIQNLKVEGSQGNYIGASGDQMGRVLHFLNQKDFPGRVFNRAMATNTIYGSIVLHAGSRPRDQFGRDNPYDLTAFFPAQYEAANALKLTITTTQAADVCDTAIDITAGTFYAEVYRVLGLQVAGGMIVGEGISLPAMMPLSSTDQYPHTGNLADLSARRDVPSRGYLKRIAVLSQDDTAIGSGGPLLAADEIDRIGLVYMENIRLFDSRWDLFISEEGIPRVAAITAAGAVTKPADQLVAGFGVIDLRQIEHPDYGLDLRQINPANLKVGLTTQNYAAGDDTILYHETYVPYQR